MHAAERVQTAFTREARPGKEAEFEEALRDFIRETMGIPGLTAALMIKPTSGSQSREFGILRTFENQAAMEAFFASDRFARWKERIAPLVVGEARPMPLHGLEAFFREHTAPPPRWKMAVATWLGVFPCVVLYSRFLAPHLGFLPPLLTTAVVNVFVVATLAWLVMPLLTKLLAPWLHRRG